MTPHWPDGCIRDGGWSFRGVPGDETEESGWQTREDEGEARVVGCEGAGLAVRGKGENAVWPVDTRDHAFFSLLCMQSSLHPDVGSRTMWS